MEGRSALETELDERLVQTTAIVQGIPSPVWFMPHPTKETVRHVAPKANGGKIEQWKSLQRYLPTTFS